jgi:exodeoxyribonuclease VII large subunit
MARPVECICDQRRLVVDLWERQMVRAVRGAVENNSNRLALLAGRLNALSPLSTLARGYCIVSGPDGALLREARQVKEGDSVTVHLYRGILDCTVREIKN